jgi:hypothetical protein
MRKPQGGAWGNACIDWRECVGAAWLSRGLTAPLAYLSCSRFAWSFMSRFSSVSPRYGTRPLHWMMGGGVCRWVWPKQQGISLFILLEREPPPVASFFRWIA